MSSMGRTRILGALTCWALLGSAVRDEQAKNAEKDQAAIDAQLIGTVVDGSFKILKRLRRLPTGLKQDRRLGQGAFGEVYEAELTKDMYDKEAGTHVAVKMLKEQGDKQDNKDMIEDERSGCKLVRMLREKALRMNSNPHLFMECLLEPTLCRKGDGCFAYTVNGLLPGHDLTAFKASNGMWQNPDKKNEYFTESEGQTIMHHVLGQLVEAIRVASFKGSSQDQTVRHQDLKPDNIRVYNPANSKEPPSIVIMDFGLANTDDGRFQLFAYPWSPPEAYFEGKNTLHCPKNPWSESSFDMWSVGALAYWMDGGNQMDLHYFKCSAKNAFDVANRFARMAKQDQRYCTGTSVDGQARVQTWIKKLKGTKHDWLERCFSDACTRAIDKGNDEATL